MSENKKYYYMKLKDNFFTSERMVVLETMPDGILYSNLLLKMYLMSLKHNGILLLHENLPHTPQTIATFTRHQIGTVERALQIFLGPRISKPTPFLVTAPLSDGGRKFFYKLLRSNWQFISSGR